MNMDYKTVVALIGKELQDEEVKAFLDEIGIKYPKKDTIGGSAEDWNFGLSGKKAGVYLNFDIDVKNLKYVAKQASRKGVFKPILSEVDFNEKTQFTLPFSVTFSSTLDALKEKLGGPVLNENLHPSFLWNIMLDADKEIEFHVEYRIEEKKVRNMFLKIKAFRELFRLYYTQYGETMESALKLSYVYDKQEEKNAKRYSTIANKAISAESIKKKIFFLLWAVDNDYLDLGEAFKGDIEKLREKKMDVQEFALKAFKDNPFITLDNFVKVDRDFVNNYNHNLYLDDVYSPLRGQYYGKDFENAFSKNEDELKIASDISQLQYSEENRRLVSEIVNKRHDEFMALKKSKK